MDMPAPVMRVFVANGSIVLSRETFGELSLTKNVYPTLNGSWEGRRVDIDGITWCIYSFASGLKIMTVQSANRKKMIRQSRGKSTLHGS